MNPNPLEEPMKGDHMKTTETINSTQMATLLLAYMTGSAIIFIPAPLIKIVKNGAWLSVLIGTLIGMILLVCLLYIHKNYPGLAFVDISRQTFGPWLFYLVVIPFLIQALIEVVYIVIGISSFFTSVMMVNTPDYVFNSLIFITAAVTVRAGIEVMARMFTLLLPVMYLSFIIVVLLVFPNYHPEYLKPVSPDGIVPILYGAFQTISFPFAELLLFSVILPLTNKESMKNLSKLLYIALLINGLSLAVSVLCTIMVLGPLAGIIPYSIFNLARLVDIANFFSRIESVIGLSLILGSFMKATIVLYVLTICLSKVLTVKNYRSLIFPVTSFSLMLSLTMIKGQEEFNQAVFVLQPLLDVIVLVIPFLLMTLITFIKRKRHSI